MNEVMTHVEQKADSDCVCHRRRNGTVKLCLWHAWNEWKVRQSVARKYSQAQREVSK